ncbi:hypothetical protein D869_gp185 [Caulobacter phage CcrRogue]|uniref:Uncharacterized protein n=1 Tax=Caulobacter phage CcrRogue TaxID=2927986 RepID=K4JNC7_9CAUD|nr:hypothetical protein D869_gp185 [Caulobacter phage CcrRogue]AFU86729.1 hypothetical protein CcrRogue_gp247 [Caulobacter phage CcrRogue]
MIDPKAKLADQVAGLFEDAARLGVEVQERGGSNLADQTLEFIADARAIIERQQARVAELELSQTRRFHTERAYLRVIQEFIAGKGDADLKRLNDGVGMIQAQVEFIQKDIQRLADYLRAQPKTKETADLIDHLDFYIFHEVYRKVHYIEHHVIRDARLALVGLSEASFKSGLGEQPEPPTSEVKP